MRIDVISDPICPWCLIGLARLRSALDAEGAPDVELHWRAFMLNPSMPSEGMDRKAYLEAKFGGPQGAARTYGHIAQTARDEGLDVDLDAIKRTPSTIDAHRMILWAGETGWKTQTALSEALFRAYFAQGRDIGDADVLEECAASCGLDAAALRARLATDEDIETIRKEDAANRQMGVNGVPCFIIDKSAAVMGAQPPEQWADIFRQMAA